MRDLSKLLKVALAVVVASAVLLLGAEAVASAPAKQGKKAAPKAKVVAITVTQDGFQPSPIKVKKGEPLLLKVTRTAEKTCATELLIKGTEINVPLPLNQTVEIPYTPDKTGDVKYGCAMGMMISGVLTVE